MLFFTSHGGQIKKMMVITKGAYSIGRERVSEKDLSLRLI